jgi:predicted metal-dependent hydrolase
VRRKLPKKLHKKKTWQVVPPQIHKWEEKLDISVEAYFLQRMKTKWGGCNHQARHIRLNTELVKKPKDLLEYVIVHEMVHLFEPTHSERFVALMNKYYPTWRDARAELNELPLGAERWKGNLRFEIED